MLITGKSGPEQHLGLPCTSSVPVRWGAGLGEQRNGRGDALRGSRTAARERGEATQGSPGRRTAAGGAPGGGKTWDVTLAGGGSWESGDPGCPPCFGQMGTGAGFGEAARVGSRFLEAPQQSHRRPLQVPGAPGLVPAARGAGGASSPAACLPDQLVRRPTLCRGRLRRFSARK